MDQITFTVERLNLPPFSKGYTTLTELDAKSFYELIDLIVEVIVGIDSGYSDLINENYDNRIHTIIKFLILMKYSNQSADELEQQFMSNDKGFLMHILYWMLQKFDFLSKRAYLAKFLSPLDIPAEFLSDTLINDLIHKLKEYQAEFKEVHKSIDQLKADNASTAKLSDMKSEIAQLEQEKTQLQNKINKLKQETKSSNSSFQEMLNVTSQLRKEQEEEMKIYDRLRTYRQSLEEVDMHLNDCKKRLMDIKSSKIETQSPEEMFSKLQHDVKDLFMRCENLQMSVRDRELLLEKLRSWDGDEEHATDEDVQLKRDQLRDLEDQINSMERNLDAAMDRNEKLLVFKQSSKLVRKKLADKEEEYDRLLETKSRLRRQIDDKENEVRASGKMNNKITKMDLQKYGAVVREKIEKYKKMRDELAYLRGELVTLQRTEQLLKSKSSNLEEFLIDLERKKGVQGYRETQRQLVEMTEKAAEVDQMKSATLEQISMMVETITREFKNKQNQLKPIMSELKTCRRDYMDVETQYLERKANYDKIAVGLELEKQGLERDCDTSQDEYLQEETKYHTLSNLISLAKIKQSRCDQERKWKAGEGSLMRDFQSLNDLYNHKLTQQDQLTKQLRKKQKELRENSGALTNQKTNFKNLLALLNAKEKSTSGNGRSLSGHGQSTSRNSERQRGTDAKYLEGDGSMKMDY